MSGNLTSFNVHRFVGFVASARSGKLEAFGVEPGTPVEQTLEAMSVLGIDADTMTSLSAVTAPMAKAVGTPVGWTGSDGLGDALKAVQQALPDAYDVKDLALDLSACLVQSDLGSYFRVPLAAGLKPADRSAWVEVEESTSYTAKAWTRDPAGRFASGGGGGGARPRSKKPKQALPPFPADATPRMHETGKGAGTWNPAGT